MTRQQDARLRLFSMRERAEAVHVEMVTEAGRFASIAGAGPTRVVSSFNLFQTPAAIAGRMAEMLVGMIPDGASWLEPSAGLGRLYLAGRRAGLSGRCVLVESSPDCCRELYAMTEGDSVSLLARDFLTVTASDVGGRVAGVLMNPPFKMGADVRHIRHAMTLLEPGGVVVALCYDGVRQNRELMPLADSWEVLPPGSFASEGTRAGVCLLTLTA